MKWKFWIQEKLYCTSKEANVLFLLGTIVIAAHGIRIIRAGVSPFNDAYYAETDSLFRYLSDRAVSMDAVDTVFTGSSAFPALKNGYTETSPGIPGLTSNGGLNSLDLEKPRDDRLSYAEVELWIFKDTLEKPVVRFPLNINQASEQELQALPGIGPQMARRIIDFRSSNPFKTTGDLVLVRGIGPKTMKKLEPLVTVSDSTSVHRDGDDGRETSGGGSEGGDDGPKGDHQGR
jgi:competence ComEA-like helix-hairpin-helix protein